MQQKSVLHIVNGMMATVALGCCAQDLDLTPTLFRSPEFNSAMIAEAVNHYVEMGEQRAIQELLDVSKPNLYMDLDMYDPTGIRPHELMFLLERIGWVCRILYSGNDGALRPPAFGSLPLDESSMPLSEWPLYPIAKSGSSYFVLTNGYTVYGTPESVVGYLKYCKANGTFRTERIPIPNRDTAIADLQDLRQSGRWMSIQWSKGGLSLTSELQAWRRIVYQAKSISD